MQHGTGAYQPQGFISGFLAGYRNLRGQRHADRHDWLRGIEHPRRNDHTIGRAVRDPESTADRHWCKERGYAASSESGTAEIVKLADWDTEKSNIFAKTAIQFVQRLPEARLLKSVVVPFESETLGK